METLESRYHDGPVLPQDAEPPRERPKGKRDAQGRKNRHKEPPSLVFHYHRDSRNDGAGGWADEDRLPRGLYSVEVSKSEWLVHLKVGQSWGTTAYEL